MHRSRRAPPQTLHRPGSFALPAMQDRARKQESEELRRRRVPAWERPPCGGLSVSGPVSRILSRAAIYLCGPPGPRRAGSTVLLGLAPGGVCLAAASPRRRCALTAPFHRCLYATHVWPRHRLCISVALSRGFPRVGVTHRPALWCPDFPRGVFSPPAVRSARFAMVVPRRPPANRRISESSVGRLAHALKCARCAALPASTDCLVFGSGSDPPWPKPSGRRRRRAPGPWPQW